MSKPREFTQEVLIQASVAAELLNSLKNDGIYNNDTRNAVEASVRTLLSPFQPVKEKPELVVVTEKAEQVSTQAEASTGADVTCDCPRCRLERGEKLNAADTVTANQQKVLLDAIELIFSKPPTM